MLRALSVPALLMLRNIQFADGVMSDRNVRFRWVPLASKMIMHTAILLAVVVCLLISLYLLRSHTMELLLTAYCVYLD
jgi:uncharacterized membrane protein YjgN (DUF898 family)